MLTKAKSCGLIIKQSFFGRFDMRTCWNRQTGKLEVLVFVRACGFKSRRPHQTFPKSGFCIKCARVVELADSLDSGSSALHGRAGSSPASRTIEKRQVPIGTCFFCCSAPADQMIYALRKRRGTNCLKYEILLVSHGRKYSLFAQKRKNDMEKTCELCYNINYS